MEDKTKLKENTTSSAKSSNHPKKSNKRLAIIVIILVIILGAGGFAVKNIVPNLQFKKAKNYMDSGKYKEAYDILHKLIGYKNSDELLEEISHHGGFRIVELTDETKEDDDESKVIKYTYNKHGMLESMNKSKYYYTYYPSGNVKTMTEVYNDLSVRSEISFKDQENKELLYNIDFDCEFKDAYSCDPFSKYKELITYKGINSITNLYDHDEKKVETYNEEGIIISQTDDFGVTVNLTYEKDDQGRIIKALGQKFGKYSYEYDDQGNIVRSSKKSAQDSEDNFECEIETKALNNSVEKVIHGYDFDTKKISYSNDIYGNVTNINISSYSDNKKYSLTWEWVDYDWAVSEEEIHQTQVTCEVIDQVNSLLKTSFLEAYQIITETGKPELFHNEMKVMEDYIPYMGDFTWRDGAKETSFRSDFYASNDEVVWLYDGYDITLQVDYYKIAGKDSYILKNQYMVDNPMYTCHDSKHFQTYTICGQFLESFYLNTPMSLTGVQTKKPKDKNTSKRKPDDPHAGKHVKSETFSVISGDAQIVPYSKEIAFASAYDSNLSLTHMAKVSMKNNQITLEVYDNFNEYIIFLKAQATPYDGELVKGVSLKRIQVPKKEEKKTSSQRSGSSKSSGGSGRRCKDCGATGFLSGGGYCDKCASKRMYRDLDDEDMYWGY